MYGQRVARLRPRLPRLKLGHFEAYLDNYLQQPTTTVILEFELYTKRTERKLSPTELTHPAPILYLNMPR